MFVYVCVLVCMHVCHGSWPVQLELSFTNEVVRGFPRGLVDSGRHVGKFFFSGKLGLSYTFFDASKNRFGAKNGPQIGLQNGQNRLQFGFQNGHENRCRKMLKNPCASSFSFTKNYKND